MRRHEGLRYVVPDEGAILWVTSAAVLVDAPDPATSTALIRELMAPEVAVLSTVRGGFATPSKAARQLLPAALRDDVHLFPPAQTRARCLTLHDLGGEEARLAAAWPRPALRA